jgi:Na+-translocating ferredoxin:NAD+ oxidoreductase subunit B
MSEKTSKKLIGAIKMIGFVLKAFAYQFKVTQAHKRLRERLDKIANGFPKTKTGAELRVLAQLFSPEEADLCAIMSDDYEFASEIAAKAGKKSDEVAQMLDKISKRGLIYRIRQDGELKYRLVPFMVGILEFNVYNINPTLGINIGMMMEGGYFKTIYSKKTPHLRSIPIKSEIVAKDKIMPYDDAVTIISTRDRISISECACRLLGREMGNPCIHPMDTCFQFNDWADYYVENGLGKYISKEEALEKLARNEEEGLVNQVANSKEPELLCSCCSCHCGLFDSLKKFPGPAFDNITNYVCQWDANACNNCGICVKRCPVGAHAFVDGKKVYLNEKCIGCGLCVTTCKPNACVLINKPEDAQYVPKETLFDTFKEMAKS